MNEIFYGGGGTPSGCLLPQTPSYAGEGKDEDSETFSVGARDAEDCVPYEEPPKETSPMKCTVYPFGTLKDYRFASIIALHEGRWLLCREASRDTWETPGGHIEPGETPVEAARRELFEETGAKDFDLYPLCDYWACHEPHEPLEGQANGQQFFAHVHALGPLPEGSEIAEVTQHTVFPTAGLTYPELEAAILPWAEAFRTTAGLR